MVIQTIVAAIALENGDEHVARRAIQLAVEHGARLILSHAIESLPAPDQDLPPPAGNAAIAGVLATDATAAFERLTIPANVQAQIRVEFGKADQVIDRLVRDHAADLLIIGPGKPQNLRERLFGSTADRLLRSTPCPILVVKRKAAESYRHVVAAIDFSPMSLAAAQAAAQVAPEAKLELVHAFEIPMTFEQAMLKAGTPQIEIDRYRRAKTEAARKELASAHSSLAVQGKIQVVRGDAATALVRLARSGRTDLLALGVQGRTAVSEMILGSVARRVLAASSCDLLLAKKPISQT